MNGNDPPGDLPKSSRRWILSLSAGALATGLAGCSSIGLSGTSELSSSDQTALEEYSDSYETAQRAKDRYENGIETFRENVGANGTIEGEYPADWPELRERMMTAEEEFSDASGGFSQASRSASSSAIESGCDIAVKWVEPHIEVAEFFGDLGGPSKEFVDNFERKISNRPAPPDPETLRERVVNGESLNVTPAGTRTPTSTSTATTSSVRHEQVDPFTEVRQSETQSTTMVSFEVPLEAGQFAHRELRIKQPSEIHITGESTAKMDVFLLVGEGAFSKYQAGESAIFSGGFTATGIETIDRTVEVSPGRYFLVFDNTPVYGADPRGEVNSQFEIVVSSGTSTPTETETATETETSTPPGENNAEIVKESDMPKIRKVTDNFGHTFVWDPDEYHSDANYAVSTDDEIVVSDDTTVTLTVEEIWADPEDTLTYTYRLQGSRHPDNVREEVRRNTNTWDMERENYTSEWTFLIWIRNQDEIYYHNESNESDFRFQVTYTNLKLE